MRDTTPFEFFKYDPSKLKFAKLEINQHGFRYRKLPAIIVWLGVFVLLIAASVHCSNLICDSFNAHIDSVEAHAGLGQHLLPNSPYELQSLELSALGYTAIAFAFVALGLFVRAIFKAHTHTVRIYKMYSHEFEHMLGL